MYKKSFYAVASLVVILTLIACVEKSGGPGKEIKSNAVSPSPLKEFAQKIEASNQPQKMKAGETIMLPVKMTNASKDIWPKNGGVHLVYLWQDEAGNSEAGDIRKTGYLEKDLPPGESISIELSVTAPDKPGKYTLILTMVQEAVAFFNKKGAKSLDIPVTVAKK